MSGIVRGLCAALLISAGCSDETGIVIEISRDGDVALPSSLEFHIGLADDVAVTVTAVSQCNRTGQEGPWFVETSVAAVERVAKLDGKKDIADEPYRLLLRPGDVPDQAQVMVVVVGKKGDEVLGIGQLPEAATFVAGKVVRWPLVLERPDGTVVNRNGCSCGPAGAILAPDDLDCDLAKGSDDCDGLDGQVRPGAPERCDGVDNDCDPGTEFNASIDCYAKTMDGCFYGQSVCTEDIAQGKVQAGLCAQIGNDQVSPTLCDNFTTCQGSLDPFLCANSKGDLIDVSCEFLVTASGDHCPASGVHISPDETPGEPGACRWVVLGGIDQDQYLAGLLDGPASTTLLSSLAVCDPVFAIDRLDRIDGNILAPDPLWLFFSGNDPQSFEVWKLSITPVLVESCPADPATRPGLVCSELISVRTGLDQP